ncbi:MAG: DUF6328 family protein [Thermoleophilia bacterium]|jgi:hypothetical protein|nr:DUF6328 family protein [Thermoleophilia bacterium]
MGSRGEAGSRDGADVKELLEELRIGLPGVQILFAFLLTVPFTQRFGETTTAQRGAFLFAPVCAGVSSALLIGPAAYHRVAFPREDGDRLLGVGTAMARAGLATLALAMSSVVFVVADMLIPRSAAIGLAGALLGVMGGLWVVLPLADRDGLMGSRARGLRSPGTRWRSRSRRSRRSA